MSQELQQRFLQSVTIDGNPVPREWIFSCVYIEKLSLNGPLLKLEISDGTGTVLDEWKARYGTPLIAEMGDPDGESASFSENFFITSASVSGDVVTVIAVTEDCRRLKNPAVRPELHTDKTAAAILEKYAASLTLSSDANSRACTFHLNSGQKPSRLLSDLARDKGAKCWTARGVMHFSRLVALVAQKPVLTYEANNPDADNTICKMQIISKEYAGRESSQFRFVGYSMTDGYIEAGEDTLPVRSVSDADPETLRNLQMSLVPVLDIEVAGNPDLTPGVVLEIIIHRYDDENQTDESIPQNLLIKNVAHFEDRVGYNTRVILAEVKY